jgi:hypothetical protein
MRLRNIAALAAIATTFTFGIASLPAQAASTHPAATQAVTVGHIDQMAVKASVAAHHGVLTTTEAKRLGIRPNTVYIDTPQNRALQASITAVGTNAAVKTAATPSALHPQSASGCNDDVCIEVDGSGLYVDDWNTYAYPPESTCSYSGFWEDGELAFTGEEDVCGTFLATYADMQTDFDNHTQLCNTWVGISGRPCEEVSD